MYQGKEGLVGCLGGGCPKELLVGSHGVGWMAWHGGPLLCFSPSYFEDDAGGREEDIPMTSVLKKVKLVHSPGCQDALP